MSGTTMFFVVVGAGACVTTLMRFVLWLDRGGVHE